MNSRLQLLCVEVTVGVIVLSTAYYFKYCYDKQQEYINNQNKLLNTISKDYASFSEFEKTHPESYYETELGLETHTDRVKFESRLKSYFSSSKNGLETKLETKH